MKNIRKTLPFLLLSSLALGLLVMAGESGGAKEDTILEDEIVTMADGGKAIAFGSHVKKANEIDTAHPVLGIDISDVGENKSIRFVAAIDGYQGLSKATWTRSVKEGEEIIKEEESFDLQYVYTVLPRATDVLWETPLEEGKTYYYMTYTLNNIPETNWWSEIDVALKTYDLTGTLVDSIEDRANVWGLLGDPTVGSITYTQYSDASDTYYEDWWFKCTAGSGPVSVAPFRWSLVDGEDHLAESLGDVVTAGDIDSSSGAFENRSNITDVHLPDTIVAFNRWCFAGAKITGTINFPSSLTNIMSSGFNSSTSINRIVYEASNLETISSSIQTEVAEFVVPATVTALPDAALFKTDGLIKQITYEGTEAEWAALAVNADTNHIASKMTICSDTVIVTATFDLQGGTTVVDGTETDENILVQLVAGTTLDEVPTVRKSGYYMAGWVLDLENPEPIDPLSVAIEEDTTFYAYWTPFPAGNSLEDPYIVEGNAYQGDVTTVPGMEMFYLKFTAQADDRYYVTLGEPYDVDEANSTTTSTSSPTVFFYGTDQLALDVTTGFTYQVDHMTPRRKNGSTAVWAIDLMKGDTIYLGVSGYYNSYYSDRVLYGTIPVEIKTAANDTAAEAIDLAYEIPTRVNFNGLKDAYAVYRLAPGVLNDSEVAITVGGTDGVYTDVIIYAEDDPTATFANVRASSVNSEVTKIFSDFDPEDTYYFVASSNMYESEFVSYVANETSSYITLGPVPDGYLPTKPEANASLGLTMEEPITVDTFNEGCHYYELTVAETGLYRFIADGGSTSYAKKIVVTDSLGETVGTITEAGTGDYWDTTYGETIELDLTLEPDTYVITVGYTSTSANVAFDFLIAEGTLGSNIAFPMDIAIVDDALTVPAVEGYETSYARFTATTTMTVDLTASDSGAGMTLYDGTGATEIKTGIGVMKASLTEGEAYIIAVTPTTPGEVTIAISEHALLFGTDYAWAQGTYMGTNAGSNYYKMSIGDDFLTWESSSTQNEAAFKSYDEARGILRFSAVSGSTVTDVGVDTNGNALIIRSGSGPYYMSKHQTTYSMSAINGQCVKTSGWGTEAGTVIVSITVDDGTRIYGAMIDGAMYPTVALNFTSGEGIKETGAVFEVTAYGTLLGTGTVTSSTTITWTPAA